LIIDFALELGLLQA